MLTCIVYISYLLQYYVHHWKVEIKSIYICKHSVDFRSKHNTLHSCEQENYKSFHTIKFIVTVADGGEPLT